MSKATRHHYTIDLSQWIDGDDPSIRMRPPTQKDTEALADLMLDAYRGTIDYNDETIVEALEEVESYFANDPDLANSRLALEGAQIASACLVTAWRGHPFVGHVMTGTGHKGKGFGTATLRASLRSFERAGCEGVGAFITAGNTPSEKMFYRVGAIRRPSHVLHIAEAKEWEARGDTYVPASFNEEGFIHCSTAAQLDRVAGEFYAGRDDLTLLRVAAVEVGSMLVYEDLYETGEMFPHVYGPLSLDAVVEAVGYSVS